jgi:hypothetical protein
MYEAHHEHTMSTPPAPPEDPYEAGIYEIRLKGHLEARWVDWFDNLSVAHAADGTTTLTGPLIDQAALYGLLRKLRDLGLPLLAVNRLEPKRAPAPAANTDTDHNHSNTETLT